MNEGLGRHYKRQRGLDNVGLRFTAVYGYGKALTIPRGTGVDFITELLEKPAAGEPGVINNGDDVPDWLYAEGFCRKVRFLDKIKIWCREFNDLQTPKLSKKQLCDRTGGVH
jgi:nucleoside-diphosphate-sugar epimerase